MKFELTLNLDNAAFADDEEVPRILKKTATAYRNGLQSGKIYDKNKELAGHFRVVEEDHDRRVA